MKPPYLQESSLLPRIGKYIDEHQNVDVDKMTDHLIKKYATFSRKNPKNFVKSVQKAYDWQMHLRKEAASHDSSSDVKVIKSTTPTTQKIPLDMNCTLKTLYGNNSHRKKKELSSSKFETMVFIDTEGDTNHSLANGSTANGDISKIEAPKKKRKNTADTISSYEAIFDSSHKKRHKASKEVPKVTLEEVAGLDTMSNVIFNIEDSLLFPTCATHVQKAFLITGPHGSGKSTFVKAIAGSLNVPVLRIMATEFIAGVSGESEENVKEIFSDLISSCPCILLMERLEAVVPKEGSAGGGMNRGMERRIAAQLTSCIQDLKEKHSEKGVFVFAEMCTTEGLDWELRAAFDEEIFMAVPSERSRKEILQIMCANDGNTSIDCSEIARQTPGFVAGDLKQLVNISKRIAWKKEREAILQESAGASLHNKVLKYATSLKEMSVQGNAAQMKLQLTHFMDALPLVTPTLKREGFPTVPDVTWNDIGGLELIKKDLQEKILDPIEHPELHQEFGAQRPNGILLWGPPGCGKTLLAKAVANQAAINLLPVMGPELLNMYQGESERAVREVFKRAASVSPCVIFFDEFDSLCPARSKSAESGSKTTIVNTLLAEMNGFSDRDRVYVMGATNRPDILDPAVTRPGRFDTLLYVGLPDQQSRVAVFRAATKDGTCPRLASDVDYNKLAEWSEGFSGADCSQLAYLASKEAIAEVIAEDKGTKQYKLDSQHRMVYNRHFAKAIQRVKPSVSIEERLRFQRLLQKFDSNVTMSRKAQNNSTNFSNG